MELYDVKVSNFGPYEEFSLPLYKQGLVWIGGINNDTDSADSNGSGKSSIFKAITWGLYGESIDGEKGDKVIRDGENKTEVEIHLRDNNGELWTISRQRSKGSPRILLYRPNGKLCEGSKNEVQEQIIRMVGLDFKAFKNTVLYGQNDSSRFANTQTKDSERKAMLHKILNTELLVLCRKKAGELSKNIKTEIHILEGKIEQRKIACGEYSIKDLSLLCDNYEIEKKERIENHKVKAIKYKDEAIRLKKESEKKVEFSNLSSIEEDIKLTNEKILKIEKFSKLADSMAEKMEKENEIVNEYSFKVASFKKELSMNSEKLELLDRDNCPTCNSKLNKGEAGDYIVGLKKYRDEINSDLMGILIELEKHNEILEDMRTKRKKYVNKTKNSSLLHKELSELHIEFTKAKLEISKAKDNSDRLLNESKIYIERAKSELSFIKQISDEVNPYQEQLEKAKARIEEHNNKIKEYGLEIKDKIGILSYYEFWVKGFSNQGLPSYILDSVMPYITERANYYLKTLSDGDITMSFSTQRELKSSKGEMRDEIEINWIIEDKEMYPPSGGQLKKMEIATDLALMDLVASNEGGNLDLLMLDEVLDGLDTEGSSRVLSLLQSLRSIRSSIFVISHESKMSEIFEKGIFSVKNDGISSLDKI